jgi:Outer membrane lipoprotein carrier protein LolA-like
VRRCEAPTCAAAARAHRALPLARLAGAFANAACALLVAVAPACLVAATSPTAPVAPIAPTAPIAPAALEQVLQLLAARRHGHVSFTEVHTLAMLEQPLYSSGELLYDAPDHLEKRTLQPKAETLLLEHGVLTARRGHRTYLLSLREYPQVVPFVESIRATLAGDREGLERFFALQFSGTLAHWSLGLVPTDPTVAHTVKEIRIEGERDSIHTVQISEADGDASLLTIGPEVGP